jgi:hypothetical protein
MLGRRVSRFNFCDGPAEELRIAEDEPKTRWEVVVAAIVLFAASGLAVVLAWVTRALEDDESGLPHPGVGTAQLVVALLGLVPVALLVLAMARHRATQARVWFVVAIATYLCWGILNDAAVHGWHHLKVF